MGSSGGGDIDCRVGTIVWVRRRNGSWWPGKILGPNELSASHLMSPRSGTPVKLLGREDASVDWYNLEKSRRVKAFRCGDFDDCIERAESSLGMPAKKREKYARREDAILHALELEKQMLYNKSGNSGEVEIATNCQEKRRKHVNLPTESIDYFNRKKILPIQMEMSPSQIGINSCHALRGSSYEGSSSESTEDDVSDSSETQSLNSATEEEMAMVSDSAGTLEVEQRSMEKSEGRDDESTSSDGLNETAVNGDTSHFHPRSSVSGGGASDEIDETAIMGDTSQLDPHGAASGGGEMSKWQLKGKRNTRSLTKRSEDLFDGGASKGSILRKRAAAKSIRFIPKSDDFESGFDEFDLIDNDTKAQAVGFDSRVYPLISKQRSSGGRYVNDSEEMAYDDRPAFKGYRAIGSKRGPFDPIFVGGRLHTGGRMKSMLIDVDLKVQASYQKEHDVPIVSLMSRLNGKAIIGRPIQIDTLEDGYSDVILSGNDDLGSESLHDGNTALQPVWRTARRTANRIPRSHLSPTSDGDGTVEKLPFHNGKKPPIKKLNMGSTAQKAGKMKGAGVPRPPMNRKIARKPLKKVSLSSSQKIRTLSSIAVEQRVGSKSKRENGNSYVAGLIKTESGQTTVACIPVKLVFSRLFEGVSRPHSRAAGHGEL